MPVSKPCLCWFCTSLDHIFGLAYSNSAFTDSYKLICAIMRIGISINKTIYGTPPLKDDKMDKKIILRFAFRETMGTVIAAIALFWSAGRVDWWAGWVLVVLLGFWAAATGVVILRTNPDLLAERLSPRQGVKKWDMVLMGMIGVLTLARLVIAGLDQRYGWTGSFPLAGQVLALVISVLGYGLVLWSTAANAYFSQTVRIQEERGHKVAMGGPYRFIRHPAYAGTILFELSAPILLASWWALIPGGLNALLFILRTTLEDRTLQKELDGYPDYARQVRFRLLPGIW